MHKQISIVIGLFLIFLTPTLALPIEGPTYIALVFDVSGSMRKHGFETAKTELVKYLYSLPDESYFSIIPFAENEMPGFERELTKANRDAAIEEAKNFIEGLKAGGKKGFSYGFYTNIDEGIDAGKLAVLQQSGPGRRSVVLISDGISDPDDFHRPIDVEKIADKIGNTINLYLIDLSGRDGQFPASWQTRRFSPIQAYQIPNSPVIIIPLQADNLEEILTQLHIAKQAAKPIAKEVKTKKPVTWSKLLLWLLIFLAITGIIFLILISATKIKRNRGKIKRLIAEKSKIFDRMKERKIEITVTLTALETSQSKKFPLKTSTSIRFGTQEGVDFKLIDPDKGVIDGQINIDVNGNLLLMNVASTFPFIINGDVEVVSGQQQPLPDKATTQVSKTVHLEIRKEIVPETTTANSVEELIKKYGQPKDATK